LKAYHYLDKGDILIDGGNTYFTDTDRRFTVIGQRDSFFWNGYLQEKRSTILALCLAVIKKPMKGYAPSLNP
jgi:hypothetical protein